MNKVAVLDIWLHDRVVGTITQFPDDRNLFAFSKDYLQDALRPTLSLSFKTDLDGLVTDFRPVRRRVHPFFSNLLPEGHLREYLSKHASIDSEREFGLLSVLGNDLPGALRIGSINHEHAEILGVDAENEPPGEADSVTDGVLRFSLAGVQLKFSALWEGEKGLTIPAKGVGGNWIVKLPSQSFPRVPANEFSMMQMARRVGIDVPEVALMPLNRIRGMPSDILRNESEVFVIRRFDRTAENTPVHIEDFAQVFGVYPEKKYRSANYRNIAQVIWKEVGDDGLAEFIRRLVFNVLIGNGDMHLKNWSVIYPDKRKPQLAPAYDFVSTILYLPGDDLALNFVDSKSFNSLTEDEFRRFASKADLPEKLVVGTMRETLDRFAMVWKTISDLPIDDKLHQVIQTHLRELPLWLRR